MEEYRTKRGTAAFGSNRVIMEESISTYIRNFVDSMWYKGDLRQNMAFVFILALVLYAIELIFFFLLNATFTQRVIYVSSVAAFMLAVWTVEHFRGFTDEKFVEYETINSVKFIEGRKWLTCPRFILKYSSEDEEKKRYITMPHELLGDVEKDVEEIKKEFRSRDIEVEEK